MTPLQQKQLAFLNETVAFYNEGNRCYNDLNGKCSYWGEGKAGCAVGRHIKDKDLCRTLDAEASGTGVANQEVFRSLPDELRELGQLFLVDCQNLHDIPGYWDAKGLSTLGAGRVAEIKTEFGLR